MDNAAANNLAQAIAALAAAVQNIQPPAPIPPAAPPAAPVLTGCTGTSLFQAGAEPLDSKFMGKVEDLHLFLSNLRQCAQTCRWIGGNHDIINVTNGGTTYNLLTDYGHLSAAEIEIARAARVAGTDMRACQDAQMMYECVFSSITENA